MKNKLTFMVLGIVFGIVLVAQNANANDQTAAALFNSPAHEIPAGENAEPGHPEESTNIQNEESTSFLNTGPLEKTGEAHGPLSKTAIHFLTGIDIDQLAAPQDLQKQVEGIAIPVSVLVYEKCSQSGDAHNGTSDCEWRYSSGFKSTLSSRHTTEGNQLISRMIMIETNREGTWQGKREVLHTTQLENGRAASETYDIIYDLGIMPDEPQGQRGARTREVLKYSYDPLSDHKQIRDMSWTKYADTEETLPREMEYHAVLKYDAHGNPEHGVATKWTTGWKDKVLFNWRSDKDLLDLQSREMWQMWEQWIKNGPAHVFIV